MRILTTDKTVLDRTTFGLVSTIRSTKLAGIRFLFHLWSVDLRDV